MEAIKALPRPITQFRLNSGPKICTMLRMNGEPLPELYKVTSRKAICFRMREEREWPHYDRMLSKTHSALCGCREGRYNTSEFKAWVASNCHIGKTDLDLMNTRYYKVWKHHVGPAKDNLQKWRGLLTEVGRGLFEIPPAKLADAIAFLSGLVEQRIKQNDTICRQSEPLNDTIMNENERKRETPTFTHAEWQTLKSLVLEFIYYDVYRNHLALKCQMIEANRPSTATLSDWTSKHYNRLGYTLPKGLRTCC